MKPGKTFSMLYVTREKYPTFRVDLTELFSRGLAGRGHNIDWVMQSMHKSATSTAFQGPNERVFVGSSRHGQSSLDKAINHVYGFLHDLRIFIIALKGKYDFIQVRDKPFAALVGLLAARVTRIPFFYWMSFPYPEADHYRIVEIGKRLSMARRLFYIARGYLTDFILYKVILPRCDHIFVQSDKMQQDVSARGIRRDKMTPIPMGISLTQVSTNVTSEINDYRLSGKLPVVYVGTLVRVRRMDFLIQAFKLVYSKIPNTVLVLVGSAEQKDMQYLYDVVRRENLEDHVIFTGFLPMEQAWGYIKAAKVCVSPFRPSPILDSTSPTKVIEYLAWGRPVVANDHPDQGKVLRESGAGLTVPYDEEAFSEAIVQLLGNEQMAESMGKCGPPYVQRYRSYEALSESLEALYLTLLGYNDKTVVLAQKHITS